MFPKKLSFSAMLLVFKIDINYLRYRAILLFHLYWLKKSDYPLTKLLLALMYLSGLASDIQLH